MRNFQFRFILSIISLFSILIIAMPINAAPVRLNQVVQVINAKPGKAATGDFSQLRLANSYFLADDGDDDEKKTTTTTIAPQQDDRVITTTTTEIVEDEVCDCVDVPPVRGGFPYWALGFAAIPLLFLIPRDKDRTPTPTQTPPTTETPTPPITQTPTPETPTPTPPTTITPTPTPPEAVPEPMTLLLFGTGLASIGLAARKKLGKKQKQEVEDE